MALFTRKRQPIDNYFHDTNNTEFDRGVNVCNI